MQTGQDAVEHFLNLLFRAVRTRSLDISLFAPRGRWVRTAPGRSGDAQVFVQVGVDDQVGRVGLDDLCAVGLELVSKWFKPRIGGTKVVARRALSGLGWRSREFENVRPAAGSQMTCARSAPCSTVSK